MRFDRPDDPWSPPSGRPARVQRRLTRACVELAHFALAGPSRWRRALDETLVGVGRLLAIVLDGAHGPGVPVARTDRNVVRAPALEADATISVATPSRSAADTAWAVWM